MDAQALFDIDRKLDEMKVAAKSTLFPQIARIKGCNIACDFEHGKRMVWEFHGIRVARSVLAGLILANAR